MKVTILIEKKTREALFQLKESSAETYDHVIKRILKEARK